MGNLLVACTLSPAALKARRENLLNALLRRAKERRELLDGYCLRFAPEGDILSAVAQAIDAERQCCRFLRLAVTVEPDAGRVLRLLFLCRPTLPGGSKRQKRAG